MARLFVAVYPPANVVAALGPLRGSDGPGVRWTAPEQWHVTLRFLADADPEVVADALGRVDAPALQTTVHGPPRRLNRSVLVVPVEGLAPLAAAVDAALAPIAPPARDHEFTGHLTLARGRRLPRRPTASGAEEELEVRWTVEEVVLVRSETAASGARHTPIARRRLRTTS